LLKAVKQHSLLFATLAIIFVWYLTQTTLSLYKVNNANEVYAIIKDKNGICDDYNLFRVSLGNKLHVFGDDFSTVREDDYIRSLIIAVPQKNNYTDTYLKLFSQGIIDSIAISEILTKQEPVAVNLIDSNFNVIPDYNYYLIDKIPGENHSVLPLLNKIKNWKGDIKLLTLAFKVENNRNEKQNFIFAIILMLSFYLIIPYCCYRLFRKFDNIIPENILKITAVAISVPLTTVFLYYFLLIFPYIATQFYGLTLIIIWLIIICTIFPFRIIQNKFSTLLNNLTINGFNKNSLDNILSLTLSFKKIIQIAGVVLILFFVYKQIQRPIDGSSDVFEYAASGKAFFNEMAIKYSGVIIDSDNGFPRPSYHAPGYPLVLSMEMYLASLFNIKSDAFYKSINIIYGLLILMLIWQAAYKTPVLFRFVILAGFFFSQSFLYSLFSFHIDNYRIALMLLSFLYMALSIKEKSTLTLFLFGVACGLSSFSHSIGLITSLISIFIFFIFYEKKFSVRILHSIYITLLLLLFGGIHYLIDVIIGTGWIIFKQ
jgi:hypothetical protein